MPRGVLIVHSVTRALAPHIEWAVRGVLGEPTRMSWQPQPASPSLVRTTINFHGRPGTGAHLASALRGWDMLHFEITEEPHAGDAGSRWMYTPSLGIHHSAMDAEGNAILTEDRIRACLEAGGDSALAITREFEKALGAAWDGELDHYRESSEEAPARRLFLVG